MLLSEMVNRFLAWCKQTRAPRTHSYYRDHLKTALALLGDRPADELRPYHLLALPVQWHRLQSFERLYHWATDEAGILTVNPLAKMRKPRPGRRQRTFERPERLALLRGAAPDLRAFLVALAESAARPQEVRVLTWEMLRVLDGARDRRQQLLAGEAYFELQQFKGRLQRREDTGARFVPITPRLGRLLDRLGARGDGRGLVFRRHDGQAWSKNSLVLRFRRLRERVGLVEPQGGAEQVCLYTFRHTAASDYAIAGVAPKLLQDLLGHSRMETTSRYLHCGAARLIRALGRFWRRTDRS